MAAKLYTADEAAKELGIAYNTLRSLIHTGKLRAFKIGNGKTRSPWKISEEALNEFTAVQEKRFDR